MNLDDLNDIGVSNARIALAIVRATLAVDTEATNTLLESLSTREDLIRVMGGLTGILMAVARLSYQSPTEFDLLLASMQDTITMMEAGATLGESA